MWVLHENNKLALWDNHFLHKRRELFLSGRGEKQTAFVGKHLMGSFSKSGQVTIRVYLDSDFFARKLFTLTYGDVLTPAFFAMSEDASVAAAVTPGSRLLTWLAHSRSGIMPEQATEHTTLRGEQPTAIAVAPAGDLVILGRADGQIELLSASSHTSVRTFAVEGAVNSLIADDQGRLFAGTQAGELALLSIKGDHVPQKVNLLDPIRALHWTPETNTLLVGAGPRLHVWDVKRWEAIAVVDCTMDQVLAVCNTAQGRIYAGGSPGNLECWASAEGEAP
jgi:WD40 repeat protein